MFRLAGWRPSVVDGNRRRVVLFDVMWIPGRDYAAWSAILSSHRWKWIRPVLSRASWPQRYRYTLLGGDYLLIRGERWKHMAPPVKVEVCFFQVKEQPEPHLILNRPYAVFYLYEEEAESKDLPEPIRDFVSHSPRSQGDGFTLPWGKRYDWRAVTDILDTDKMRELAAKFY